MTRRMYWKNGTAGLRAALSTLMLVLLTVPGLHGCGGGGGGSGASAPLTVTADRSAFGFAALHAPGATGPAAQSINFTISGGTGTLYGLATSDNPAMLVASFSAASKTVGTVTLTPVGTFPDGTTTGSVRVDLCSDAKCAGVVWSQSVPYTVTVFTVDSTPIVTTGFEGAAAPAHSISISPPDPAQQLSIAVTLSTTNVSWLTAARASSSSFVVNESAVGLSAGSYSGEVTITIGPNGFVRIPVTFTVGDGIVAPAVPSIDLSFASSTASLASAVPVSSSNGQSFVWSASSDQAWLVLDVASGTAGSSLQYHVNPAPFASLANWASYTANVSLTAPGMTTVSFPVVVNRKIPDVLTLSPDTLSTTALAPYTVQIVGRGLSQLPGVSAMQFNPPVSGVTGTITSDTTAVLQLPAVAAGGLSLSVTTPVGLVGASGRLDVVAPVAFSYATVAQAGTKRHVVIDASRNAVFTADVLNSQLVRYQYANGAWTVSTQPVANLVDAVMAPDKAHVIAVSYYASMVYVDPVAMTVTDTVLEPSFFPGGTAPIGGTVTSNGRLWMAPVGWGLPFYFDMIAKSFLSIPSAPPFPGTGLSSPELYAGTSGRKMVAEQCGLVPTPAPFLYDAGSDTWSAPASMPQSCGDFAFSIDGAHALHNSAIYDTGSWAHTGTMPTPATGFVTLSVLSGDASRIYALVTTNINSIAVDHVQILDATQVDGSANFVEIGQIPVTSQAFNCTLVPGCADPTGILALSPLGDTLFWVGDANLVVIPIPSNLRPLKPAAVLMAAKP